MVEKKRLFISFVGNLNKITIRVFISNLLIKIIEITFVNRASFNNQTEASLRHASSLFTKLEACDKGVHYLPTQVISKL